MVWSTMMRLGEPARVMTWQAWTKTSAQIQYLIAPSFC